MKDSSQRCPSEWEYYNDTGIRTCGRPTSNMASCTPKNYIPAVKYSGVCGRVIGYQFGSPDGFSRPNNKNLTGAYLDGVSITYGDPPNHIWSYVAGVSESSDQLPVHVVDNCPCSRPNNGSEPPPTVGDSYYCESGNSGDSLPASFYQNDPLWDGQQCEGTCCAGTKSPPWFSVQLPAPTTDDITVSICGNEGTDNENTSIELLEIFVQ